MNRVAGMEREKEWVQKLLGETKAMTVKEKHLLGERKE